MKTIAGSSVFAALARTPTGPTRAGAKAGVGFTALDNGFAAVDDPAAVSAICEACPRSVDRG